ncbi:The beta subunit is responsible for the synthesis of L- tryptophan from indole and L-serine [Saitoella coloradoensis]
MYSTIESPTYLSSHPDPSTGLFGPFGAPFLPPPLQAQMDTITAECLKARSSPDFIAELASIRRDYQGRPTPVSYCRNLSERVGGGKIFLKREDLNHTGAHKFNHWYVAAYSLPLTFLQRVWADDIGDSMAEALLAKRMGKKKLIAETGAGQHGVALATACAYFSLACEIHMGSIDVAKDHPNVTRMRILGATIIEVNEGAQTLKEAVDSAFKAWVGDETGESISHSGLPDHVVACVGGGSNAMGIVSGFLDEAPERVTLHAVEPAGRGTGVGEHASSLTYGKEGIMHGFNSIMLTTAEGSPAPVHSIASGLDYPSVGPEHAFLQSISKTTVSNATDKQALAAFFLLSRCEGIIPALESAHAVAYAVGLARGLGRQESVLVNLSGRADKDMDYVMEGYGEMAGWGVEDLIKGACGEEVKVYAMPYGM